jgi:hypothetical protein
MNQRHYGMGYQKLAMFEGRVAESVDRAMQHDVIHPIEEAYGLVHFVCLYLLRMDKHGFRGLTKLSLTFHVF